MTRRPAVPATALGLAVLTIALAVATVLVGIANQTPVDLTALSLITFLAFPAMGVLILRHRPNHLIGWLLLAIGVDIYLTFVAGDYSNLALVHHPGSLPFGHAVAWISGWLWIPFALMVLLFVPMLFPDGRLLSRRWRIVVASGLVFAALAFAGNAFAPGPINSDYPGVLNPLALPQFEAVFKVLVDIALLFGLAAMIGSVASVVVRYRRGDSRQRQQLRWFLVAVIVAVVPFVLQGNVPNIVAQTATGLTIPLLPISIAIAVLRYRLYDIDVVINRAVVYGALAAFISVVYVAIVVGIGAALGGGTRPNLLLSIVATAVVAVAFQPVRERIQRMANRLVYGRRATPYEVMAGFADRMADTLSVDEALPRTAEAAARGVGATAARVTLLLPDGSRRVTSWPDQAGETTFPHVLPVRYQGETIGEIAIRKSAGEILTPGERRLLADLAAQAGLVLHNVRLTAALQAQLEQLSIQAADLRASRQRIVTAQETERRRLESEIRAGVQPELEAMAGQLADVDRLLGEDLHQAIRRLEDLTAVTQHTLDELRELARGIFPPLLADKGLVPALQAQIRKVEAGVAIQAADDLESRRFEPGIEAAVYFSCLEALRRATTATVIRLADEGGELRFSVHGLATAMNGEMQDSQDRIAAVGGTLEIREEAVSGRIPLTHHPDPPPQGGREMVRV